MSPSVQFKHCVGLQIITCDFDSHFLCCAYLSQLRAFKNDNADVGFGSGTLALEQSIERTTGNIKWLAENKDNVLNWLQSKKGNEASY